MVFIFFISTIIGGALLWWPYFSIEGLPAVKKFTSFCFIRGVEEKTFLWGVIIIRRCIALYCIFYAPLVSYFIVLLLLFVGAMLVFIMGKRLFWIFVGWDGLGVVSFLLVAFYNNWKSINGRIITFMRNRIGDSFLILFFGGVVLLIYSASQGHYSIVWVLLLLAGITKRAQLPFSRWLPEAIAAPTPISALVHSSTLVTAGVFLLWKFGLPFKIAPFILGGATFFIARLAAALEQDFKKIVAYSTLRQIGVLFISLRLGLWWLFFFHLVAHAFFKRLLFMGVGALLHSSWGVQDKRALGSHSSDFILGVILLTLSALTGLLFLGGMVSKDMVVEGLGVETLGGIFIILGLGLSLVYSLKMALTLKSSHSLYRGVKMSNSSPLTWRRWPLCFLTLVFGILLIKNSLFPPEFLFIKGAWVGILRVVLLTPLLLSRPLLIRAGSQWSLVVLTQRGLKLVPKLVEDSLNSLVGRAVFIFTSLGRGFLGWTQLLTLLGGAFLLGLF